MSAQEKMQKMLVASGIPAQEVKCYGSQIMVTAWSAEAANKWHTLLSRFCTKVRPVTKSMQENKVNQNTVLLPSSHPVWLVWGTV